MMAKKRGRKPGPKPKTKSVMKPKAKPRERVLPGMEDSAIGPLEAVAASYAEIRDERMALTQRESELKKTARALMHKYHKQIYRRNGIEIMLVEGEEDVKVRIKKPQEEAEEPAVAEAPDTMGDVTSDPDRVAFAESAEPAPDEQPF